MHWRYWSDLKAVSTSVDAFLRAEEALSRLVYEGARIRGGQSVLDVGCGFAGTLSMINEEFSDMRLAQVHGHSLSEVVAK